MRWFHRDRPERERIEGEQASEDARVHVRALTERLAAEVDRLAKIADKLEEAASG